MAEESHLASRTLAKLYLEQKAFDKALEVLFQLKKRFPQRLDLLKEIKQVEEKYFNEADSGTRKERVQNLKRMLEIVSQEKMK